MRKIILVLMLVLFLFACSKGAEVEKKLEYADKAPVDEPETTEEVVETEEETEETEEMEEAVEEEEEKKEVPEGVATGTCSTDSKGVVRVYSADGSKKVYRHDCTGGMLVKYTCEYDRISERIIPCSSGKCLQGPYGDQCAP